MLPQGIQSHVLTIAEAVSILLAYGMTPDSLRQALLNFARELKTQLPKDSIKQVEAAEAEAIIRAVAYRRDD